MSERADSMLVFDLRAFARDYSGSPLAGRLKTAANELDRLYEVERRAFGGMGRGIGETPKESPIPHEKETENGAVSFEGELLEQDAIERGRHICDRLAVREHDPDMEEACWAISQLIRALSDLQAATVMDLSDAQVVALLGGHDAADEAAKHAGYVIKVALREQELREALTALLDAPIPSFEVREQARAALGRCPSTDQREDGSAQEG